MRTMTRMMTVVSGLDKEIISTYREINLNRWGQCWLGMAYGVTGPFSEDCLYEEKECTVGRVFHVSSSKPYSIRADNTCDVVCSKWDNRQGQGQAVRDCLLWPTRYSYLGRPKVCQITLKV
jgi:hypothetical protein